MFTKLFRKAVKTAAKTNYRKVQSWDALNPSRSGVIYAPTTKRRPVVPPGRKSIPLSPIEGLPSGGQAEKMRKTLTDFGSPWRGLTGIPQKLLQKIAGGKALGLNIDISGPSILREAGKFYGTKSAKFQEFSQQIRQAKQVGFKSMVFLPTSKTNIWGKEVPIKYTGEQFRELKSTIRHERTHQFNPEMSTDVIQHFKEKPLSQSIRAKLSKMGYKGLMYDEMSAIMSEIRYHTQFVKKATVPLFEVMNRMASGFSAYGSDIMSEAMSMAGNRNISLVKSRPDLYRRGRSISTSMQTTTNYVKANTTGMTVPGLAQSPRRGGSRQGPQGGT